jgi:HEAT repeat protein
MKKLVLTSGMILAGSIVLFLLWPSAPEPTYQGRPITGWLDDLAANKNNSYPAALQHIGTNALPYAVRNLALNDSIWRSNYSRLQAKMPGLLQWVFRRPKPLLQEVHGANVFLDIGSNSIPCAIALLKHDSPTVRRAAAWGLGGLRRQTAVANQAIPALTDALSDKDRMVRFDTALSLEEMGPAASNAVPALTRVVAYTGTGSETNDLFYLRAAAAVALGKIGPAATNALPALRAALHESDDYLRGQSAVAIWRISGDVDTTLPVLLHEMPATVEDSKWDWIIAVGEMGPRAKAAVPQLRIELQQDRHAWVLAYVTNAFRQIDPDAAAQASAQTNLAAKVTVHAKQPPIYDESADGSKQIAAALATAAKEHKRVLLMFGANWCGWCHKLHTLFETDNNISDVLKFNFVVVMIDVNKGHNSAVDARYESPTKHGLPVIVILDADGKQLTTEDTNLLEDGDHHSPQKVLAFLKQWTPKP